MTLKDKTINKYQNGENAAISKHFLSFLIDVLVLFGATLLLYLGSYQILISSNAFVSYDNTIDEEVSYYNALVEETHLINFNDGERYTIDAMTFKLLNLHISYSYYKDNNSNFTSEPTYSLEVGVASTEDDFLSYYYTVYVPSHNEDNAIIDFGDVEPLEYYKSLIKEYASSSYDTYFISGEDDELFYINPYVANRVYKYYYEGSDDGSTEYQYLYSLFYYAIEEAELSLIYSSPYYETHYVVYLEAITGQANMYNVSFMLTSMSAYLLVLFIPQLVTYIVLGNTLSLGRLVTRTGVFNNANMPLKFYQFIPRVLLGLLASSLLSLLIPILPMFNFSFNSFSYPLIGSGSFSYGLLLLVIGGVLVINGLFTFFNSKKRTLVELATLSNTIESNSQ